MAPVAYDILLEFFLPEFHVGLGGGAIAAAVVPMPEAAVDKHCRPVFREHKIRGAGQLSDMKSIAESPDEKKGAKGPFRPGVLAANARHHAAALRGSRDAHGLGGISSGCLRKTPLRTSASQSDRGEVAGETISGSLACS